MSPSMPAGLRKCVMLPRRERRAFRCRLTVEALEDRTLLSGSNFTSATPLTLGTPLADTLSSAGQTAYYQVTLPQDGQLQIQTHATSAALDTRTSLLSADPNVAPLIQSDGQPSTPDDLITQNLTAGTWYVKVEGLNGGTGSYVLSTQFAAGYLPYQAFSPGNVITAGDFNGDGASDIVVDNGGLSLLRNNGDGTFQTATPINGVHSPRSVIVGDFNGDGHPDLAMLQSNSNGSSYDSLAVLPGNGDGTFQAPIVTIVGGFAEGLAAGDFNGDDHLDLATLVDITTTNESDVLVLLGNGDGTFQAPQVAADLPGSNRGPASLVAGHFTKDSYLDLAAVDTFNSVSVLFGNGDGSFQAPQTFATGLAGQQFALVAGDFNNDGIDDLATATADSSNGGDSDHLSVLLSNGDGTFQSRISDFFGLGGLGFATGDFNSDGNLDLIGQNGNVVLLGNGDGTFTSVSVQTSFLKSVAADYNGDGRLDLLGNNGNAFGYEIYVLFGNGDGTFQGPRLLKTGQIPFSPATGDLNGDGHVDFVAPNIGGNSVSVFLGNGDGSFQPAITVPSGEVYPESVVIGDFNGDGRPDLAVANFGDSSGGTLSILLGNGDGTFQLVHTYSDGATVAFVYAADLRLDGRTDLVITGGGQTAVYLSNGDGSFQMGTTIQGTLRLVGDFNGDGIPDLFLAGPFRVALGKGDGTFPPEILDTLPPNYGNAIAGSVVAGDFNGDGRLDLATVYNYSPSGGYSGTILVLLGNGDGTFQAPLMTTPSYNIGYINTLAVGDFNSDGHLDLVADGNVFLGNGDGTFQTTPLSYPNNDDFGEQGIVVADFNGDGHPDIAATYQDEASAEVWLGDGTGHVQPADAVANPIQAVPLLVHFTTPAAPDSLVLNSTGTILFRAAQPLEPGAFQPPVPVNPTTPARDIALVLTSHGWQIAAIDAAGAAVSLYRHNADGSFTCTLALDSGGSFPTRILAANLTGNPDGLPHDLVVYNTLSGSVTVFLSDGNGGFLPASTIMLGLGGSSLALSPEQGGPPDILITNQISGDVTVLRNDGHGRFSADRLSHFRASTYPYGWDTSSNTVQTFQYTAGMVVGDFSHTGQPDIVVLNPGGNNFAVLAGQGGDSYLNPASHLLPFSPGYVASGDFNRDGNLDLAILDPQHNLVYIYVGDGHGHFTFCNAFAAGNNPTGLTVADITRPGGGGPDGNLDLLIGNTYGDILVLAGNGDGSFQPYERVEHGIPLAVVNLNGQDDFLFADQGLDQVSVQYGSGAPVTTLADAQSAQPVLGPGAIMVADLNGDGVKDLIVANSGSNDVLVFLGNTDGTFQPARSFFAGDNPVGITVANLKGPNAPPDLVIANEGSNDVSVLYGQGSGSSWTLTYGPRLASGGIGPVSSVVQDVNGDGIPDILASNSASNNVALIPGVGQGLFNDASAVLTPVGSRPGQIVAVTTPTGPSFVVLDSGGSTLTELSGFNGTQFTSEKTIDAHGFNPVFVIAFDRNADGFTDLLVANNDTAGLANPDGTTIGNIVLLEQGGDGTFEDAETFSDPEVPNPSAIALSALHGDSEFYATSDGVERAVPFFFHTEPPKEPATPPTVTTHVVSVPDTPGFVSQVEASTSFDPLATQVKPALPPVALALTEDITFTGQDAVLTNFELLLTGEGGKGGGDNFLARWSSALDEAQHTWLAGVTEGAAVAWETVNANMQDMQASAGTLLRGLAEALSLDRLELPNLHWRETGRQMVQITVGSVRTSWEGTALAEMGDRLFAACEGAVGPLLPAVEPPAKEPLPALDGARDLLRGLEELVRPPVPGRTDASAAPARQAPADPAIATSATLVAAPDASSAPAETERPTALRFASAPVPPQDRPSTAWDMFWLTAAVVGLLPALTRVAPSEPAPDTTRLHLRHEG